MTAAVHVAGWTLVHFAWQGTLVVASAALALQWLRHSSPHSRYVVACVALAAMLIIPGGTAWRLSALPRDGGGVAPFQHRALFVRAAPQAAAQIGRASCRERV